MVKKTKKQVGKPNKKTNDTKSDQLELAETAKNSSEVEGDDESININQIAPRKIFAN